MYPFVDFFGRSIPTYGLCLLIGVLVTFVLSYRLIKEDGISIYDLLIIGAFALLFALPCGSILYAIATYSFKEILHHLLSGNIEVFGGLVFYGALIGGLIGAIIGVKVAKVRLVHVERAVVPFVPVGHAIGRVGCVLAGCCYGMEYDGLCAISYAHSLSGAEPGKSYFPVQLLEACLNIVICFVLLKIRKKVQRKFGMTAIYLLFYSVVRFIVEFFRGDSIRGYFLVFSTSQFIALLLFAGAMIYLLLPVVFKRLAPSK